MKKAMLDENRTYIMGAYIDVLDDNIEQAKEDLKKIDKEFSVVTVKSKFSRCFNSNKWSDDNNVSNYNFNCILYNKFYFEISIRRKNISYWNI